MLNLYDSSGDQLPLTIAPSVGVQEAIFPADVAHLAISALRFSTLDHGAPRNKRGVTVEHGNLRLPHFPRVSRTVTRLNVGNVLRFVRCAAVRDNFDNVIRLDAPDT